MKKTCNSNTNQQNIKTISEDEVDYEFITQVVNEVTQSCALPLSVPIERIPFYIKQAAQWFWENYDGSVEERWYIIPNSEICKGNNLNKLVKLPPQIMGVHGCYKTSSRYRNGAMGDFSMERMMLSTYSSFGGVGSMGSGTANSPYFAAYNLGDVVTAMLEVSTFDQTLNSPLTYEFNRLSSCLNILGDLGWSDLLICTSKRCKIQDLYKEYYFFRFVVALVKKSLSTIYSTYEFKLPGGVTINYSNFKDEGNEELEDIKEWVDNQKAIDWFFQPNTL